MLVYLAMMLVLLISACAGHPVGSPAVLRDAELFNQGRQPTQVSDAVPNPSRQPRHLPGILPDLSNLLVTHTYSCNEIIHPRQAREDVTLLFEVSVINDSLAFVECGIGDVINTFSRSTLDPYVPGTVDTAHCFTQMSLHGDTAGFWSFDYNYGGVLVVTYSSLRQSGERNADKKLSFVCSGGPTRRG